MAHTIRPIEPPIPFNDLRGQYEALRAELDAAIMRVLASGWYVLGEETAAFEEAFAAYCSCGDQPVGCVGVNSGTDALMLALRACDIGPGHEVITVAHTAVATAAAIRLVGATPIFVDIQPATYTIDVSQIEAAITSRTRAIVPVHIYGHPVDMEPLLTLAATHELRVIEDCAQAHGARFHARPVGTLGDLGCFSFYPTKNLGALGDGGAVISTVPALVERVRLLREYGWSTANRYVSQIEGTNSRLDEIQAAALRVKLGVLDAWNARRRTLAARYGERLPSAVRRPLEIPGCHHVYHLYVVRIAQRNAVRAQLAARGIGSGIHYPMPIHRQPAYVRQFGDIQLPVTERFANEILSLPLHPLLEEADVDRVAEALSDILS
jgi:dTDP-3-amino-3,4,6-trideoxy-alpha-D-glucose transaminase